MRKARVKEFVIAKQKAGPAANLTNFDAANFVMKYLDSTSNRMH
jgi:hypothetical protein